MDNSDLSAGPIEHLGGAEQPLGDITALSPEMAIKSLQLLKAKTEADAAEYEKRLVMQQFRPCKMYPVVIYHDGMRWVCSMGVMGNAYSDYLPDSAMGQSGVEGYGEFPEQAMQNFDAMWVGMVAEELADAANDSNDDSDDSPDDDPDDDFFGEEV
jgi:hypothetical protein